MPRLLQARQEEQEHLQAAELLQQEPVEFDQKEALAQTSKQVDFVAVLAGAPASELASASASRDCDELPHEQVHKPDNARLYTDDSDSTHNAS